MVTRVAPDIDWSTFPESDGEPMAETSANVIQMLDLEFALQTLFDIQERSASTSVGGNQLMYYNPRDGRDHVSPDVYVAFDRRPPAPPSWRTWEEGKFPDIVWEITSPSTRREDVGRKHALYAQLEVGEYYIYDPQQETNPPFLGFALRGGRLEPLPVSPGGGIMSVLLGAELRPMAMGETERRPDGMWLRVIDPRSGLPLPTSEEVQRDLGTTRHDLQTTRHDLQTTRRDFATMQDSFERMRRDVVAVQRESEQMRQDFAAVQRESEQMRRDVASMRERMTREEQARLIAEQRAVQAEAALRAMLDTDRGRG